MPALVEAPTESLVFYTIEHALGQKEKKSEWARVDEQIASS
jgi:hypothetical protein